MSRLIYSGNSAFRLLISIKMLSARIRTVLGRMTDSALPLQNCAEELSQTTSEVSAALNQQNSDIRRVRDATQEVESSANSVSSSTNDAHMLIDDTFEVMHDGQRDDRSNAYQPSAIEFKLKSNGNDLSTERSGTESESFDG